MSDRTVWKFPIPWPPSASTVFVDMPMGATMLTVQLQYGVPCIWAKVDPLAPHESRRIAIVGTGHGAPPDSSQYLGTVLLDAGTLVLHFFSEHS